MTLRRVNTNQTMQNHVSDNFTTYNNKKTTTTTTKI